MKILASSLMAISMLLSANPAVGNQIYKCKINGSIQYQQTPCANDKTTSQDNSLTDQKKPLAQNKSAASSPLPSRTSSNSDSWEKPRINSSTQSSFKCDSRKYCTQMKSCEEAKYFLANCPGVKMDGDRDGIPCEEQHCH